MVTLRPSAVYPFVAVEWDLMGGGVAAEKDRQVVRAAVDDGRRAGRDVVGLVQRIERVLGEVGRE